MRASIITLWAAVLGAAGLPAGRAHAACNLIPSASQTFRSTLGATNKPYAAPGDYVEIAVSPGACDASSPGLGGAASDHVVTAVFTPPSNGPRRVAFLTADACSSPTAVAQQAACEAIVGAGRVACLGGAAANLVLVTRNGLPALSFRFPDTDALFAPDGDDRTLAGPVVLAVTAATDALPCGLAAAPCAAQAGTIACIDALYAADGTCQPNPEPTFPHFTALPVPNDYAAICVRESPVPCNPTPLTPETRYAVDLFGNLLVPFNWQGVLVDQGGVPVPRLMRATVRSPLPVPTPPAVNLGSFTPEGAPLPPIFEPTASPDASDPNVLSLFGSVDAAYTILRLARRGPLPDDLRPRQHPGCAVRQGRRLRQRRPLRHPVPRLPPAREGRRAHRPHAAAAGGRRRLPGRPARLLRRRRAVHGRGRPVRHLRVRGQPSGAAREPHGGQHGGLRLHGRRRGGPPRPERRRRSGRRGRHAPRSRDRRRAAPRWPAGVWSRDGPRAGRPRGRPAAAAALRLSRGRNRGRRGGVSRVRGGHDADADPGDVRGRVRREPGRRRPRHRPARVPPRADVARARRAERSAPRGRRGAGPRRAQPRPLRRAALLPHRRGRERPRGDRARGHPQRELQLRAAEHLDRWALRRLRERRRPPARRHERHVGRLRPRPHDECPRARERHAGGRRGEQLQPVPLHLGERALGRLHHRRIGHRTRGEPASAPAARPVRVPRQSGARVRSLDRRRRADQHRRAADRRLGRRQAQGDTRRAVRGVRQRSHERPPRGHRGLRRGPRLVRRRVHPRPLHRERRPRRRVRAGDRPGERRHERVPGERGLGRVQRAGHLRRRPRCRSASAPRATVAMSRWRARTSRCTPAWP